MVSALRVKEQRPKSVSYWELFQLLVRLSGGGIGPMVVVEQYLKDLCFAARVRRLHGDRAFRLRYEDIVDRRLEKLEEYLGLSLASVDEVAMPYRRVARSKGHGDWRNWFLAEDVEFFRPRLQEHLEDLGYGDDWELPAEPQVTSERASGYLMRLAEERGKFCALEYDASSFPPETSLIANPSLDRRPYEIPRIRPKQVTVYPSHGGASSIRGLRRPTGSG